eukprot:3777150-Rhodomonas_salina.1
MQACEIADQELANVRREKAAKDKELGRCLNAKPAPEVCDWSLGMYANVKSGVLSGRKHTGAPPQADQPAEAGDGAEGRQGKAGRAGERFPTL